MDRPIVEKVEFHIFSGEKNRTKEKMKDMCLQKYWSQIYFTTIAMYTNGNGLHQNEARLMENNLMCGAPPYGTFRCSSEFTEYRKHHSLFVLFIDMICDVEPVRRSVFALSLSSAHQL